MAPARPPPGRVAVMSASPEPTTRDDLLAKYRAERDKRLRPDGNDQYIEPTGRFAHFLDDPYVPVEPRQALHDEEIGRAHV